MARRRGDVSSHRRRRFRARRRCTPYLALPVRRLLRHRHAHIRWSTQLDACRIVHPGTVDSCIGPMRPRIARTPLACLPVPLRGRSVAHFPCRPSSAGVASAGVLPARHGAVQRIPAAPSWRCRGLVLAVRRTLPSPRHLRGGELFCSTRLGRFRILAMGHDRRRTRFPARDVQRARSRHRAGCLARMGLRPAPGRWTDLSAPVSYFSRLLSPGRHHRLSCNYRRFTVGAGWHLPV